VVEKKGEDSGEDPQRACSRCDVVVIEGGEDLRQRCSRWKELFFSWTMTRQSLAHH